MLLGKQSIVTCCRCSKNYADPKSENCRSRKIGSFPQSPLTPLSIGHHSISRFFSIVPTRFIKVLLKMAHQNFLQFNYQNSEMSHKVPIHSTSLQSNPTQHNPENSSILSLKGANPKTFVSHVGTMGATSSTHESSTQLSLPTSSTQSSVSTSVQSFTVVSTTSSIPRSTTNGSESVEENIGIQHQGYLLGSTGLDGRLYIGVRDKELFPSGPCSSIIYESFGERADLNGYSWATLSDETKLLYWDEFHRIRSSKGSSEMHREQYEDNNAETKVEIENLKKLVETQREQYEDIQQKYEDVQQKYEDAQKKNVEFQQKNVDVQAKFEQQLAQAMNVINTLSEHVKTFINQ
ncbi:unnamed protein product [Lactuca virosa]|uniref:Uncharacterized protein n=1 Tax=Lactuca virosa TaxID=75947 RepID=A0AAU9NWM8_9ASTR|nr:unnamed protein product [Lactuca virosa]